MRLNWPKIPSMASKTCHLAVFSEYVQCSNGIYFCEPAAGGREKQTNNKNEPEREKKGPCAMCKQQKQKGSNLVCSSAQISVCSTVEGECIGGQRRSRSDCAKAQSDLGLRCPHKLFGPFSQIKKTVFTGTVRPTLVDSVVCR